MYLIWTAWNEGRHAQNGAGYGIKIPISDRDKYFKSEWKSVILELPYGNDLKSVQINTAKPSFWGSYCHELISKEIGLWLLANNKAPWEPRKPPRLKVLVLNEGRFRLHL